MKKLLFTITTVLTITGGYSQTVTNDATLKKLHPAFYTKPGMFSSNNGKTNVTFKFNEEEAFIVQFGGTTIYVNKVKVGDEEIGKKVKIETPEVNGKKVKAVDALSLGEEIYLIAEAEDKKTDKITIFAYKINFETMSVDAKGFEILSYTEEKGISHYLDYSENNKTLLVNHNINQRKGGDSKVIYAQYDKNFKQVWEYELKAPTTSKTFYIERHYFKDENNMLLTCIEYPDGPRRTKKDGKANYKYHLFYYTNKMKDVKDYELDLNGKFITDISAGINDNGQIITAGFYSEKGSYSLDGCFYMAINAADKSVIKSSLKEFSNEYVLSLMNKRQKRKAGRKVAKGDDIEAPEFELRQLYYDKEGNALLIAEDFYVVAHCTTDPKTHTTHCTYTYHYDDLIAIAIDKNGDIMWNTKIDKKLVFGGPVGKSFVTIDYKGKWIFVYNENLKNLKGEEDDEEDDGNDRAAGRRNSAPVIVILDGKTGKHTKEVLMMPEGKRSVTVDNYYQFKLSDNSHVIKITDGDGAFYYRIDLKL